MSEIDPGENFNGDFFVSKIINHTHLKVFFTTLWI